MYYLYLDESGNLGHQLLNSGTSRFFVITILEVRNNQAKRAIEKAVARSIKNKIHTKRKRRKYHFSELKAAKTSFAIKKYFYTQIASIPFNLYAVILDKKQFIVELQSSKRRVYNFATHLALKEIPLEAAATQVTLTFDKSMGGQEVRQLNESLYTQFESRIAPNIPFSIFHDYSHENKLLQAVDFFAWGIYRKYETGDTEWYDLFGEKIVYEQLYPPQRKKESEP